MENRKYDRMARLFRIIYLLYQSRTVGISVSEIARLCEVSKRQIYRDLNTLQDRLEIPIWEEGSLRGIEKDYFLPPIHFSLPEAMTIFLASRLLLSYSNAYNPSIATAFMKLNSIVPGPFGEQIRKDIELMQRQKKDEGFFRTLSDIGTAWKEGRCARIQYEALNEPTKERIIEPYFIQPGALERGTYVIARCRLTNSIRTFKIERIRSIELLNERYTVPESFDANEYLGSSWGITTDKKARIVKLKFSPDLAKIAEETKWHPTQVTQLQLDKSAIVTMKLYLTEELYAFILGWGENVEVLEPKDLRERIAEIARATVDVYAGK